MSVQEREIRTGRTESDSSDRAFGGETPFTYMPKACPYRRGRFGRGGQGRTGRIGVGLTLPEGIKQTGHAIRCMPGYIKSKLRLLVKTECDRNVVPYVYGMAVHLTGGKFLLQGTDSSYSFLVEIGVFTTSHLNFTDRTILGNDE